MATRDERKRKARRLLELHTDPRLLVLPNIWSPIGARVLQKLEYPAVATASAAVSASLGFADGEKLKRSTVLDVIGRIASSVDVPVTADIETGYAATLAELEDTIAGVIEAGVVGVNIEDALEEGGALRDIGEQCERIAGARQTARRAGIHLVINARVDCFLSAAPVEESDALEETIRRAIAYVDAGADCIYPIGPGDEKSVRALRERIAAPINILATPAAAPLSRLEAIGVNRVSFGPYVFRSLLRRLIDIATQIRTRDDYESFSDMLTKEETGEYLSDRPE